MTDKIIVISCFLRPSLNSLYLECKTLKKTLHAYRLLLGNDHFQFRSHLSFSFMLYQSVGIRRQASVFVKYPSEILLHSRRVHNFSSLLNKSMFGKKTKCNCLLIVDLLDRSTSLSSFLTST